MKKVIFKIDDELLIDLLPSDESETIVSKTLIDKMDAMGIISNLPDSNQLSLF